MLGKFFYLRHQQIHCLWKAGNEFFISYFRNNKILFYIFYYVCTYFCVFNNWFTFRHFFLFKIFHYGFTFNWQKTCLTKRVYRYFIREYFVYSTYLLLYVHIINKLLTFPLPLLLLCIVYLLCIIIKRFVAHWYWDYLFFLHI